jgi:GT2 family glycosyltransferase
MGIERVEEAKMRVTVAIPCYNGAAFVDKAIASILSQSHPADQIIVIDDGSTDNSAEIIARYPVHLIRHETNKGLAAARNTAMAEAKGDILVFVDVDVIADPRLIEALLTGYTNPRIAGVGGQGIEANVHSLADRWRRAHAQQSHGNKPKYVDFLHGLCMSFRLECLREIGGFDPTFRTNAEDVDVSLRLKKAGYQLYYQPDAKVYHQRTDNEASLKRTMIAWYVGAYRAKRINHDRPWTLFAGTLRRMISDPISDLIIERDPKLAKLSWEICWLKLQAVWAAQREMST